MQMFQKGRSMIEMLGVLAIIGVLSIGGLLGYRRAVNNHQANQILDDANRLAFVVMESGQAFEPYNNITGLEFTQTSPYFMNAFTEATSQQFAIMVTNVPKGVCEALLPKASVEYKVRTLVADTIQEIAQVSPNSTLYTDSTDICNDINDVILYFGDVSKQCTSIDEKECTSYADCCYGEFCWFLHATDEEKGIGKCYSAKRFTIDSGATGANGEVWIRPAQTMNWWSAQDWCLAQGLEPATHTNIGCVGVGYNQTCTSSTLAILPTNTGFAYWLTSYGSGSWYISTQPGSQVGGLLTAPTKMGSYLRPLCLRR